MNHEGREDHGTQIEGQRVDLIVEVPQAFEVAC